ncbi:hypothetical protein DVH24_019481 [Malus domestica]|uniref:DC1 domain-containing protein n=1 Tax=Malus domestica TaxID=3750 RepID=A0A498I657_MALDO|nr:hypothetical protein DVH24_019481 [Malus domestica]
MMHRHPLFVNLQPNKEDCRGCGISLTNARFSCIKCQFHLCVACVKLPPIARYKYHNDPLRTLTYHEVENELREYYCETCEGSEDEILLTPTKFETLIAILIAFWGLGRYPQVKYNAHPGKLTYYSDNNELGEYYCEICIHWLYSYSDCDFHCHAHCVLGRYPQVNLGGTYKHPTHSKHLVTLVEKRA